MDDFYDDKGWDDFPPIHQCGSCIYFQHDTCVNPCGYRCDEHVSYIMDACDAWEGDEE